MYKDQEGNKRRTHHYSKNRKQVQANTANPIDLTVIELGILPLSLLNKRPWNKGQLIKTRMPHRRICKTNVSILILASPVATFATNPTKQNKLSNASVANIMNIGDEDEAPGPNSIISFSYLSITSSSATLAVISNAGWENPADIKTASMKPNK